MQAAPPPAPVSMLASPADLCFHCQQALPAQGRYSLLIEGSERAMCCPGCVAVAASIVGLGLEQYYRYRSAAPDRPEPDEERLQELALYDREDLQRDFVTRIDATTLEANLLIEGVHCAACVWLIENSLQRISGVEQCSLSLSSGRARVRWRPEAVKLSRILQAIHASGYQPYPYQPDRQQQLLAAEQRQFLKRLGVAGIGMMQAMMYAIALYAGAFDSMAAEHRDLLRWASLVVSTPVALYAAYPFHRGAWRGLKARRLGMDVPVSLAILFAYFASFGATLVGGHEVYFDSVCMFTFFLLLGRFLELRVRRHLNQSMLSLYKALPETVTRLDDGQETLVPLRDLQPGDRVLVKAGQRVPADGVIIQGSSSFDEAQLTGEFRPLPKQAGDQVSAGSINQEQPVSLEISALGADTRLARIMQLVERAAAHKPPAAILADKVAQYFVALILIIAAAVALTWYLIDPARAFWITLAVMVATCPCALSLATPVALTAATGQLQRAGFLIHGAHCLETLARADRVIFDKTGTLTRGELRLQQIIPLGALGGEACLDIAAALEAASEHPIAAAFGAPTVPAARVQLAPSRGLEGWLGDECFRIGRADYVTAFTAAQAPQPPADFAQGLWLLLGNQHGPLAWLQLTDRLRDDAATAVAQLHAMGIATAILSGDYRHNVEQVADALGITEYLADCSPQDKMTRLREWQAQGQRLVMVGDGINDVPVVAMADVSIAMTNASDLTKAHADAALLSGELVLIPEAIRMARATKRIIRQNLSWAALYNLSVLPAAALGFLPPYLAAIGMSASSLVVVLNATRLLKQGEPRASATRTGKPRVKAAV